MKQPPLKKLNISLTNRVISLHQKGYTDDFSPVDKTQVQCVQNGERFSLQYLNVCLIDCAYDLFTRSFQYVHTIDTLSGRRGLLITNGIFTLNHYAK